MFESLPTGVVKGGLTVADLALPPLDTTMPTPCTRLDSTGPGPWFRGNRASRLIMPVSVSNRGPAPLRV